MVACLILGFTAVRRRDIAAHRAWMIRAYAIALAAGTQVFTEGIGGAVFGTGELSADLAKGAGWVVNLAIAEWAIRRSGPDLVSRGARPGFSNFARSSGDSARNVATTRDLDVCARTSPSRLRSNSCPSPYQRRPPSRTICH